MTKEEFLESYLTNLRNKLNALDFSAADQGHIVEEARVIRSRMWNRFNAYFSEHFMDELTDKEIEEYFQLITTETEEIIKSLPVDIKRYLN